MGGNQFLLLQELLITECSYLQTLQKLNDVWLLPMQELQRNGKIDSAEVSDLFGDVAPILMLHRQLMKSLCDDVLNMQVKVKGARELRKLRETLEGLPNSGDMLDRLERIGDIFLQYSPFFKVYRDFANRHAEVARRLDSKKDKGIKLLLKSHERNLSSLHSLLIAPVQRLPRYLLLLREMLKLTRSTALTRAHDLVQVSADWIDAKMGLYDTTTKAQELARRLRISMPLGRLLHYEFNAEKHHVSRRGSSRVDSFLFAGNGEKGVNCFIYGKRDSVVGETDLSNLRWHSTRVFPDAVLMPVTSSDNNENTFQVVTPEKTFVVTCASAGAQKQWFLAAEENADHTLDRLTALLKRERSLLESARMERRESEGSKHVGETQEREKLSAASISKRSVAASADAASKMSEIAFTETEIITTANADAPATQGVESTESETTRGANSKLSTRRLIFTGVGVTLTVTALLVYVWRRNSQ